MPPKDSGDGRPPRARQPVPNSFMPWATLIADDGTSPEMARRAILEIFGHFRDHGATMSQEELLSHIACGQVAILSRQTRVSNSRRPAMSPKDDASRNRPPRPKMFMPWASLITDTDATAEEIRRTLRKLSDTLQNEGLEMSREELLLHIACGQVAILSQQIQD